jgi:hypothetical protein
VRRDHARRQARVFREWCDPFGTSPSTPAGSPSTDPPQTRGNAGPVPIVPAVPAVPACRSGTKTGGEGDPQTAHATEFTGTAGTAGTKPAFPRVLPGPSNSPPPGLLGPPAPPWTDDRAWTARLGYPSAVEERRVVLRDWAAAAGGWADAAAVYLPATLPAGLALARLKAHARALRMDVREDHDDPEHLRWLRGETLADAAPAPPAVQEDALNGRPPF